MAEVQLQRIRSLYGDVKGLLSQIPTSKDDSLVKDFIVDQFNQTLDELSDTTATDYSKYKVPGSERNSHWTDKYPTTVVRGQIGRVVSRIEEEYGFGREHTGSPNIAIFNKNQNDVSIKIDYTINDVIEEIEGEEEKQQLRELRDELAKRNKDWEKIRGLLIWCLNFSKEVFLKILPILLQNNL